MKRLTVSKTVIAGFLLLPLLLLTVILFRPDQAVSAIENRTLTTKDNLDTDILGGDFQNSLEQYLCDQFPLRGRIKQAETEGKLLLGVRESGGAYIGRDFRLFQKLPASEIDRAACQKYARKVNRLSEKTGLPLYVMYVPSSGIALADLLPQGAPMYHYEDLYAALSAQLPAAEIIDLLPVLSGQKDCYFATDHHWTTLGAYCAYQAWCEAHGIQPSVSESDLTPVTHSFQGTLYSRVPSGRIPCDTICALPPDMGLTVEADGREIDLYDPAALKTKDKYNYFQGGNHGTVTVTNPHAASDKTLLLLKDSFANSLLPFLAKDYHKIVMLDERYAFWQPSELAEVIGADEIAVVREIISVP